MGCQGQPHITLTAAQNKTTAILRGRVGFIHSWVLHSEEQSAWEHGTRCLHNLPVVVFVKFQNATWVLDGLSELGLYPIVPRTGKWYLDSGRNYPMLKISRRQLPLAPAFAMTAHACQCTTLPAAIVDMQSGRGSYVALTRTETHEDLFDLPAFRLGALHTG